MHSVSVAATITEDGVPHNDPDFPPAAAEDALDNKNIPEGLHPFLRE